MTASQNCLRQVDLSVFFVWLQAYNSNTIQIFLTFIYKHIFLSLIYCLIFNFYQADYLLGDNPMKMSYLVGYGDNYPQQVHHRGASIPVDANTGCNGFQWLNSTSPNPNVAMGALVGGPFKNESFIDSRNNSMQTEPSTYNSAVLVGLLSGLVTTSSVSLSLS